MKNAINISRYRKSIGIQDFGYSKNKETDVNISYDVKLVKKLDSNKVEKIQYTSFLIKDEKLLEKYKSIQCRISNIIGEKN